MADLAVNGEGTNPTLVIVAGRNGRDSRRRPDAGILTQDFIQVDTTGTPITVIIVSDGVVYLDRISSPATNTGYAYNTSIVCAGLEPPSPHYYDVVSGPPPWPPPTPSGIWFKLQYSSVAEQPIDWLKDHDALPGSSTVGARFNMIAGTWQDKTP